MIRTATEYLFGQKDDWGRAGQEIDGAFALATVLAVRRNWREVSREIEQLVAWLRSSDSWMAATKRADEINDESCKVAQTSGSLISIIWTIVRAELPLLLEDLSSAVAGTRVVVAEAHFDMESALLAVDRVTDELAHQIREAEGVVEEAERAPAIVLERLAARRATQDELRLLRKHLETGDHNEQVEAARRIEAIGRQIFKKTWIDIL